MLLAQKEYQYLFVAVYNQGLTLYIFHQGSMTDPHWHDRFNKKVVVSESIGVTRKHKALLEYVSQEVHPCDFDSCIQDQQEFVCIDSEDCYISYALLRQSGNQSSRLKVDLQNSFTTGNNIYPKSRPQALKFLGK